MRILVMSDSHGRAGNVLEAIEKTPDAEAVIFLGDGEDDIDTAEFMLKNRRVIKVAGNCDFYSQLPSLETPSLGGKRLYCTHGYTERVKWGTDELKQRARSQGADIVLYGHTHMSVSEYDDGLYIFNPGALRDGCYGVVDITDKGVMLIPRKL